VVKGIKAQMLKANGHKTKSWCMCCQDASKRNASMLRKTKFHPEVGMSPLEHFLLLTMFSFCFTWICYWICNFGNCKLGHQKREVLIKSS